MARPKKNVSSKPQGAEIPAVSPGEHNGSPVAIINQEPEKVAVATPIEVKKRSTRKPRSSARPKDDQVIETVMVQCSGCEWDVAMLKERAVATYVAEGHRQGRISKMDLYIKPEERKAYYVMNSKNMGSIVSVKWERHAGKHKIPAWCR